VSWNLVVSLNSDIATSAITTGRASPSPKHNLLPRPLLPIAILSIFKLDIVKSSVHP
jgi:hypothetical protein